MPAHRLGATTLLWHLLVICITQVSADGTGILGAGKWLYRPTCAHSCRRLIINSPLVCDDDATSDHTSGSHSHSAAPSTTCFLNNAPFLRTLALCLSTHCASDDVPLSTLQEYWEAHVATGTLSNHLLTPALPYHAALRDAELEQANRTLGNIIPGEPLNETMLVAVDVFLPWYNYQKGFEDGEIGHGRNRYRRWPSFFFSPSLIIFQYRRNNHRRWPPYTHLPLHFAAISLDFSHFCPSRPTPCWARLSRSLSQCWDYANPWTGTFLHLSCRDEYHPHVSSVESAAAKRSSP